MLDVLQVNGNFIMANKRILMTPEEKAAQDMVGMNNTSFTMTQENKIEEILKKEETRKYNEQFDDYADRLEKHVQGLKDVSDELGADIEKIEIKPMFSRILILPLAQNPFQRIKESKSGIVVDMGGFAPEFTNPDTGKVEQMEQMIITGVIQEIGPEVKYLQPGDVVMYRKETAMPVPFFKQGLVCIAENQVIAVVNEGLEKRFNNVRK